MSTPPEPIIIEPNGDLLLHVRQQQSDAGFRYRVDSKVLRQNSRYFDNLLSDRFAEGQEVSKALEKLKSLGYATPADALPEELPSISIQDVGRISKVSSIENLVADFLRILHNKQISPYPPLANVANIAIVADRFDAVASCADYIGRKKYIEYLDAKSKVKSAAPPEERIRQKLLVGLLFDFPAWVSSCSKHLILRGSSQWKADFEEDDTLPLWWNIPEGVEDEMIQRRELILETINSLQAHFLKLYSDKGQGRQCKLGYDSSAQCDSFQLGEMVRFFVKGGTLRLQGTIYDPSEPTYHQGDIERLILSLREISAYQIDRFHAHCGIRVRILPLLDMIERRCSPQSGRSGIDICATCWKSCRSSYAWTLAKRPVLWMPAPPKGRAEVGPCGNAHTPVREMFMATDRMWTNKDGY
ncbi:hypothetical protein M011DRAFT_398426 [Sporormia fimetaria CBS 119925]|uniref:BTB domain-containing protein n=1 Tax=Sporormia fimetaria CBS 119925 TaxID=1340428 RepID=A0A6A6VHF7_9PLEO|nr:hypothetical protein M011DRAFT_398426 [Sporormia fimetaria CBS 119925]